MIRTLAAAAALATLALAGSASAQTYGQPVYLNGYGRPVGGTPLTGVEMRSYGETGRWADGSSERLHVYVPGPGSGFDRYGGSYRSDRHDNHGRYDSPSRPGYRDGWGYSDDRPPSAQRGSDDRRGRPYERDCGCSDAYLYDR